jgi:hypothetical protein
MPGLEFLQLNTSHAAALALPLGIKQFTSVGRPTAEIKNAKILAWKTALNRKPWANGFAM